MAMLLVVNRKDMNHPDVIELFRTVAKIAASAPKPVNVTRLTVARDSDPKIVPFQMFTDFAKILFSRLAAAWNGTLRAPTLRPVPRKPH